MQRPISRIPGFVPSTQGELFEYTPTWIEITICFGIWAIGLMIFTLLAKAAIGIESGEVSYSKHK